MLDKNHNILYIRSLCIEKRIIVEKEVCRTFLARGRTDGASEKEEN